MLVMNYFEFSLYNGNENINPNNDLVKYQTPDKYWKLNDELSLRELEELKPDTIISFKGRHNKILRKHKYNVIKVSEIYMDGWVLIQLL